MKESSIAVEHSLFIAVISSIAVAAMINFFLQIAIMLI